MEYNKWLGGSETLPVSRKTPQNLRFTTSKVTLTETTMTLDLLPPSLMLLSGSWLRLYTGGITAGSAMAGSSSSIMARPSCSAMLSSALVEGTVAVTKWLLSWENSIRLQRKVQREIMVSGIQAHRLWLFPPNSCCKQALRRRIYPRWGPIHPPLRAKVTASVL